MSSRSGIGTRKTTSSIDRDSPKLIERSSLGQTKRGSDGSEAAHKLSFGLVNAIQTHSPGRPLGEDSQRELIRDLNSDSNLRMKSQYGNGTRDERRDARIAAAYVAGDALVGKSTATRAFQAYQSASSMDSAGTIADRLGSMKVRSAETGRSHFLRNHADHM